ncbi:MAG: hypothetical protein HND52_15035 [Ignavibacteriae bacterium]|nr:hypothetical protein [Ignavibacteriota bacterium]NOG99269.1 hypothetical protein [Ignavibacteriota bacterium]
MSETKNLYFIPILANAFESEEPIEAMEKALLEIIELGEQEEYQFGYEQFKQFLKSGFESKNNQDEILLNKLFLGLESNIMNISFEEKEEIINKIKLNKAIYEKYQKLIEEYNQNPIIEIEIYKNEKLISSQAIDSKNIELYFTNIEPGNYSIRLSNGRFFWEGEIKSEDVTLDDSQPHGGYILAADTDEDGLKPTQVIELIKNEMQLYIYAGLEFGKFKIVIK